MSKESDKKKRQSEIRTDVLARLEPVVLLAGENTEGVGTEVVTLRLEEVGRDNFTAVAIEEGEGSAEGRCGDTPEDSLGDDTTPSWLSGVYGLVEEVVEEERFKVLVLVESVGDVTEEDALDDATASPHRGNASVVQVPVELENDGVNNHTVMKDENYCTSAAV